MRNATTVWRPLEETVRETERILSLTDNESDVFEKKKGTKQCDPLSSLLFNAVLQLALKNNLANWQRKGMGIRLGDSESDCLTNLRFADDVLLFVTSMEQLQRMLCDLDRSTEKVGLKRNTLKMLTLTAV